MKIKFLTIVVFLFASITTHAEIKKIQDPYANIEYYTLSNGLKIYLSPQSKAKNIDLEIKVNIGHDAEKENQESLFHTLEHVLFHHEKLPKNMTFLQVVKEKGGRANGTTTPFYTNYYTSINAAQGEWLVNMYHQMIFNHNFTNDFVKHSKREVLFEIGPVENAYQRFVGIYGKLMKSKEESFWEREFNYKEFKDRRNKERENVGSLTTEQIKKQYENYYYPSNMTLYLAGNFNIDKMKLLIQKTFGTVKKREGLTHKEDDLTSNNKKYKIQKITTTFSYISTGTKFDNASAKEILVLKSYNEFLAHRLMKKIRNLNADTYTVSPKTGEYKGNGYSIISLSVPNDKYDKYHLMIEEYLDKEAREGGITTESFDTAMNLFVKNFELIDSSSKEALKLIKIIDNIILTGKSAKNPYELFKEIDITFYNKTLKKFYRPSNLYEVTYHAPVLFRQDRVLLGIFTIILCFLFFRKKLTKEFKHNEIRWVRKAKFVSFTGILISLGFSSLIGASGFIENTILYKLWQFTGLESHFLANTYLKDIIFTFSSVSIFFLFVSFIPRKFIVCGDHLVIKSLGYFSQRVHLSEVKLVETNYFFPMLKKMNWNISFWNWSFITQGVHIQLKSGKSYFVKFRNAEDAVKELNGFLSESKVQEEEIFEEAS